MYEFSPTTSAGRPPCAIDFTRLLPSGVTVSSCVVTAVVHPTSEATDSSPSSRLDGSPTISSAIVTQFFLGGVNEVDYVLTFLATFSNGQKEPVQAKLPVRAYL